MAPLCQFFPNCREPDCSFGHDRLPNFQEYATLTAPRHIEQHPEPRKDKSDKSISLRPQGKVPSNNNRPLPRPLPSSILFDDIEKTPDRPIEKIIKTPTSYSWLNDYSIRIPGTIPLVQAERVAPDAPPVDVVPDRARPIVDTQHYLDFRPVLQALRVAGTPSEDCYIIDRDTLRSLYTFTMKEQSEGFLIAVRYDPEGNRVTFGEILGHLPSAFNEMKHRFLGWATEGLEDEFGHTLIHKYSLGGLNMIVRHVVQGGKNDENEITELSVLAPSTSVDINRLVVQGYFGQVPQVRVRKYHWDRNPGGLMSLEEGSRVYNTRADIDETRLSRLVALLRNARQKIEDSEEETLIMVCHPRGTEIEFRYPGALIVEHGHFVEG